MAEPMSDERLAEMAEKLLVEINMIALDYGRDDIVLVHNKEVATAAVQVWREQWDDEVERLRAKVDRDHDELRDKRFDLLEIRGILKPADRVEPVVPMPLGPMVAPAVEWLANDRDRLRAELAEYRAANTRMQQLIIKRAEERDRARVERSRAEAERARLAEETEQRGSQLEEAEGLAALRGDLLDRFQAENNELLSEIKRIRADSSHEVIAAAIEAWDKGEIPPHDALVAIRDHLAGRAPGEEGGSDVD